MKIPKILLSQTIKDFEKKRYVGEYDKNYHEFKELCKKK